MGQSSKQTRASLCINWILFKSVCWLLIDSDFHIIYYPIFYFIYFIISPDQCYSLSLENQCFLSIQKHLLRIGFRLGICSFEWATIMEHFRAGHTDQTVHFPIFLMFFALMLSERNLLAYIISFYRVSIKWNYTFSRSNVRREWQTLAFN